MTELWGNQKLYQLLLTNRGRFGKAEFCTTNVNWARAREILSATDRDTVRTRTISAKISQRVIISDNNGFPISDQHSRIPLSLFKLHSLPPSSPSQFCEVFSCSYLFKAFEFHFILQLHIWRNLKLLLPRTSKTIAVRLGGRVEKETNKRVPKPSSQPRQLHRKLEAKLPCKSGMPIQHYYKTERLEKFGLLF